MTNAAKLRQNRDAVIRYLYEHRAGKPAFALPGREVGAALGLSREELDEVGMLMTQQGLFEAFVGGIGLSREANEKPNALGPPHPYALLSGPLRSPSTRTTASSKSQAQAARGMARPEKRTSRSSGKDRTHNPTASAIRRRKGRGGGARRKPQIICGQSERCWRPSHSRSPFQRPLWCRKRAWQPPYAAGWNFRGVIAQQASGNRSKDSYLEWEAIENYSMRGSLVAFMLSF